MTATDRARLPAAVVLVVAVAVAMGAPLLPPTAPALGEPQVAPGLRVEVVATGISRPIQLAWRGTGRLVVLSHGWKGDAAGEIYHLDLSGPLPVDAERAPRWVIPFPEESRKAAFGSLAVDADRGDLFLGEENGNRIYRLGADQRLQPVAVGLNHLLGGSALVLDQQQRLVFLDYASPETHLRSEAPLPPSLSWLVEEGYRGPLVFRIDPREQRPLPRRADLLAPVLPRGGAMPPGQEPLWRLIAVTATADDNLVFLSSVGEVLRLGPDSALRVLARLPPFHYHRTNLAMGPDGSVFVCGGFHIRQIFRISPAGEVSIIASELGDPGGIVLDREGVLYVAETALHRIIRIAPTPLRPSPR
jgi:hypothetical protein